MVFHGILQTSNCILTGMPFIGYSPTISICYETHQKAKDILEGRKIDPTFYPVIYGADESDDWTDPKVWKKAKSWRRELLPAASVKSSLDAQKEHYKNYITSRDDWTFAGLYFDEGITGTKADKRPMLLRLIEDCKAKKIEIFIRTLIQCPAHGSVGNGLKQRLSADLSVLPKAFFFVYAVFTVAVF